MPGRARPEDDVRNVFQGQNKGNQSNENRTTPIPSYNQFRPAISPERPFALQITDGPRDRDSTRAPISPISVAGPKPAFAECMY